MPADVRLAALWSNPPVRVGKAALHDLLDRWLGRLDADGAALLVVQKHLGADSLARWLESQGLAGRRGLGSRARLPPARGRREADGTVDDAPARSDRAQAPPPRLAPPRRGRLALLLDHVQSPFNVGAILRTAAAFRVDHLWLAGRHRGADRRQDGQDGARVAALRRRGRGTTPPPRPRRAARDDGYRVVGIELADDAVPLPELVVTAPVCLVLGHEDRGLSPATLAACDAVALHPPARTDRLAQRRHRRRHRPLRGAPPGLDRRRLIPPAETPAARSGRDA